MKKSKGKVAHSDIVPIFVALNKTMVFHTDTATGCSPNEIQGFFYAHPQKCGCLSQTLGSSSEETVVLFSDTGNGSRSCILPKMLNKATVMKQKKTALLTVKTEELNFFLIGYDGLEDLSQEIFNLSVEGDWALDPAVITLPSGKNYEWDYWMAHYCFAKGRLSDSDFVAHIFNDEPEGAVAL